MNEIPATVMILDRPYKLKVRPEDEQYLRKAAAFIDSQARNYGKKYAYNDRQDLLAMVALAQVSQVFQQQDRKQFVDDKLASRLEDINQLLDQNVDL